MVSKLLYTQLSDSFPNMRVSEQDLFEIRDGAGNKEPRDREDSMCNRRWAITRNMPCLKASSKL